MTASDIRNENVDLDTLIEDVVAQIEMDSLKDVALAGCPELWRHRYERRTGPDSSQVRQRAISAR
jgi:hypothetical protein